MAARTQGERITSLEKGLSDHESRCEERLVGINARLSRIETVAWGIVMSLLAFCALTLWSGQQARLTALERPAAVSAAVAK